MRDTLIRLVKEELDRTLYDWDNNDRETSLREIISPHSFTLNKLERNPLENGQLVQNRLTYSVGDTQYQISRFGDDQELFVRHVSRFLRDQICLHFLVNAHEFRQLNF